MSDKNKSKRLEKETNYIFCMNIKFNNEVLSSQFRKQNKYIHRDNQY